MSQRDFSERKVCQEPVHVLLALLAGIVDWLTAHLRFTFLRV